ncbi:hypothetical protein A3709_19995 [Halioglobus sp. HI00S01]|uniref:serine hydrolase n=1 Tax=Halioglobus sp. HI00S01 TaxID=1822214 RepID=UPI0007C2E805|nr:serine hydrolase [Halioglobus sp. HI00S01]KZX57908.1 hypothetical protein A3709_19995 [Halioglobus sp. HI00S01]
MSKLPIICMAMLFLVAESVSASPNRFGGLAGEPRISSASAMIVDKDGNVLFEKDASRERSIASITKLMTAMVALDSRLPLDEMLTVTREDRDTIKYTKSRLPDNTSLSRLELILLTLMSSENKAAMALGRNHPGGKVEFVAAMNRKARYLGMHSTNFTDPAGLSPENKATARDLVLLLAAANDYQIIRDATTNSFMRVYLGTEHGTLDYHNTNRLLSSADWAINVSKTGFINEAGRCLVMHAELHGEDVNIVLLNASSRNKTLSDSYAIMRWLSRSN